MSAEKVLVVEDERDIAELMCLHLKREGHESEMVDNGEEALRRLKANRYSLVVLDWMLPGLSGLEVCKRLRTEKNLANPSTLPVLMVTARAHTTDIVVGLEMGADDYLTKPFEIPVFVARVRALLRRSSFSQETPSEEVIRIGGLLVNAATYDVTCDNESVSLTPSEFKLLLALVRNRGRVLTRERLIDLVQGEGVTVIDRAIDTHVFGLRKKLGRCADVVETIRGVGYRVRTDFN